MFGAHPKKINVQKSDIIYRTITHSSPVLPVFMTSKLSKKFEDFSKLISCARKATIFTERIFDERYVVSSISFFLV